MAHAPVMLFDSGSPLFLKWRYLPRLLPWLVPFLLNARRSKLGPIVRAIAALTEDSVEQHMALARGTVAEKFIKTGDYAFLYRDRAAFLKESALTEMRRSVGFTPHEANASELFSRDPNLSERYSFAAIYPDHGWLTSPGGYVAALGAHFQRHGGHFHLGEVVAIENKSVILQGGKKLTADKIILAGGAWSGHLTARLGMRAKIESERGYHVFLRGANIMPPHPIMVTDAKFVATPMDGGLRCAGIVEFGGLDAPPSEKPIALLKKRIKQVYPHLTWDACETWMGHRPSTPDSLPHLGAIKGAPDVICAFGAQHVGLTVGPRLGRLAAGLALGQKPNIDLSPYRPDRFS